jgi:hypothetical protein
MKHKVFNKITLALIVLFSFILNCCSTVLQASGGQHNFFDFYLPWDDASESCISLDHLNHAPAGKYGFVFAHKNGHLATGAGRIRFWGINFCFGANFPSHKNAEVIAARLRKFGVNLVHFHHMDMRNAPDGIWQSSALDRGLSAAQLDKLDYFIFQLKKQGIYCDINLLVSRPFHKGQELHPDIQKIKDWKQRALLGFFDPAILDLQKRYARDLLTHINTYTGIAYTNEPAVVFIEINNENGLVQGDLQGKLDDLPAYYKKQLNALWNK